MKIKAGTVFKLYSLIYKWNVEISVFEILRDYCSNSLVSKDFPQKSYFT